MRKLLSMLLAACVAAGVLLAAGAPAPANAGTDPLSYQLTGTICANTYGVTGITSTTMARLSVGDSNPPENPPYYTFNATVGHIYQQVPLIGYTFYPADDGGTPAWATSSFQTYILNTLKNEAYLGTNFIRPTDQFDGDTAWDGTTAANQVWSNMDYLVCEATKLGVYVQLDLSFVCKVILANKGSSAPCFGTYNGTDLWTAAYGWKAAIDALASHYAGWNTIAYVSFYGEGGGVPADQTATTSLANAYSQAFTEYAANDSSSDPQLLTAGGFSGTNDGYQGGSGVAPWWQQVCNLSAVAACLVKTYSQHDINYSTGSTGWFNWMQNSGGKAVVDGEFGAPQCNGDTTPGTDCKGTGIAMDRTDFYDWNFNQKFAGWSFWNDSCAYNGTTDDDVSNLAGPGVVAEIQEATGASGTGNWISGLNGGNC